MHANSFIGFKWSDRLTEVKLGKLLGTSRTPIREAIRLLELDGLVTIVAGSGARVSRMTVEDLQEVMEIRSALEQLSAGLASERITEAGKVQLREACTSFNRLTQTRDSVMIAEADVRFHDLILKAAKNGKLKEILDGLGRSGNSSFRKKETNRVGKRSLADSDR